MKTEVVFEDNDIIVINKPAGMATQTAKIGQQDVVSELKNYLARKDSGAAAKKEPYLGIIHRLDQPVEGLLIFAKSKQAAAALTKQLGQGSESGLNKQYYAIICGQPANSEGTLVDYLRKNANNMAEVVDETDSEAKKAVLHYRCLQTVETFAGKLSLMDIRIETGRFHQIRAQMSHAGMSLVGDAKYADEKTREIAGKLGIRNVALCAYALEFTHPVTGAAANHHIVPKGSGYRYFSF